MKEKKGSRLDQEKDFVRLCWLERERERERERETGVNRGKSFTHTHIEKAYTH